MRVDGYSNIMFVGASDRAVLCAAGVKGAMKMSEHDDDNESISNKII